MSDEAIERELRRAEEYYEAGNYRSAEAILSSLIFDHDNKECSLYSFHSMLLGSVLAETGRPGRAKRHFENAIIGYRARGERDNEVVATFNLGNVAKYSDDPVAARTAFAAAAKGFAEVKNAKMERTAWLACACSCDDLADLDTALAEVRRLTSDEVAQPPLARVHLALARAKRAGFAMDHAQAIAMARDAVRHARESGHGLSVGEALLVLGQALAAAGQFIQARASLLDAAALFLGSGDRLAAKVDEALSALPTLNVQSRLSYSSGSYLPAPLSIFSDPTFLDQVIAYERGRGYSVLSVEVGGRTYVAPVDQSLEDVRLKLEEANPGDLLKRFAVGDGYGDALVSIAIQVSHDGAAARADGDDGFGLEAYGFGAEIALLRGDVRGFAQLCYNLLMLERSVAAQGVGAIFAQESAIGQAIAPEKNEASAALRERAVAFAAAFAGRAQAQIEEARSDGQIGRLLDALCAWYRVLLILQPDSDLAQSLLDSPPLPGHMDREASAHERRRTLDAITSIAEAEGQWPILLELIYAEIASTSVKDLLGGLGLMEQAKSSGEPPPRQDDPFGLGYVLSLWRALRPLLEECANETVYASAMIAFERLNRLRIRLVMAGGAFGHHLSYAAADAVSKIGRDTVTLALALDHIESALQLWEMTRSRALTDWMGRSHNVFDIIMRRDFMGSIGETRPAYLDEMEQAASHTQSAVLVYFAEGSWAYQWIVMPDGEILAQKLGKVESLIRKVHDQLPLGVDTAGLVHNGAGELFLQYENPGPIEEALSGLGSALLSVEALDLIIKAGCSKLVVIADPLLESVPFCALRHRGQYLVERFEVSYWPSVAAWLLCVRTIPTRTLLPPLVMGNPTASEPGNLALANLPASSDEAHAVARLLSVKALVKTEATLEALHAAYQGPRQKRVVLSILHLATHGVLDTFKPGESYLLLADGPLTVTTLREFDPGFRANLVVLSACQTALGKHHPDSLIGLTNAFLIAGACTVLSSQWKISDRNTRQLMEDFYGKLLEAPEVRPATALAGAQRRALANPSTAHPYWWAAFKLTGADMHPCPDLAIKRTE